MNGDLRVAVDGTRVVRLESRPPLAAKILDRPWGPELILVGAAAGLLEGDTITVDLTLRPGARLTVRSTAATLAHPCPGGGATSSLVRARLGCGARLVWIPEPLVACGECRHHSRSFIDLERGAAAVWCEAVALGRSGEQAGAVDLRLDVTLDGTPLLRDGFRNDAGSSPAVLGGLRHCGSVHLLGRRPAAAPGVMPLAGPGATLRAVAADAASLENKLGAAREAFVSLLSVTEQEALVHG